MWSSTGRSLALAVALAGCADEPDAVVTVIRQHTERVTAQLCSDETASSCSDLEELFLSGEPSNLEKTIGLYVGDDTLELTILFATFGAPNYCQYLTVSFAREQPRPVVTLPDNGTPSLAECSDCDVGICNE